MWCDAGSQPQGTTTTFFLVKHSTQTIYTSQLPADSAGFIESPNQYYDMARIYQETGVEPSQQPLFHPAHLEANQPVFTSVSSTAPPTTVPPATTSSLVSVKTEPVVEDAYPMKVRLLDVV